MSNAKREVKVLIAVPSFRGTVMVHTLHSLIKTVALFGELGIQSEFMNIDAADIIVARNTFATYAWRNPALTHILFVDDDMSFEPDAVIDLMRAGKPIIGCICPRRSMSLQRLYDAARAGLSYEQALTESADFVTRHHGTGTLEVQQGLIRVAGIGMGVTLINTDVLRTMVERKVAEKRNLQQGEGVDAFGNTFIWGFFEPLYSAEVDSLMSEDLSFCERWTKGCDGEIWATVDRTIGHIGNYVFTGRYIDRLKMGKI